MNSKKLDQIAAELMNYFANISWPVRIDNIADRVAAAKEYEQKIAILAHEIEARPEIRDEWMSLPAPTKPGEKGEDALLSVIERLRLAGPTRARDYLLGAILRKKLYPEPTHPAAFGNLNSPVSSWSLVERFITSEEDESTVKIEIALTLEMFMSWLDRLDSKSDAMRSKRWLESRYVSWASLWKSIESDRKSGQSLPGKMILFTQILLDIGCALLLTYHESASKIWSRSEKSQFPPFMYRWMETSEFEINAAQLGSLWSQATGLTASLSTTVRLLSRPWRSQHPQIKAHHATTVEYLTKRKAA